MNEVLINGLAVIGAISCVIWVVKGIKSLSNKDGAESETAAAPVAAGPEATAAPAANDDIPVIAAAIFAMLQSHRIVHIEDAHRGVIWTAEGRWMQQTSHNPH
jgi:hypothetical protein